MTQPLVGFDRAVSLGQLLTILGGIVYFGVEAGRRDEALRHTGQRVEELGDIVTDLTKAQVAGAIKDANHDKALEDLQRRLSNLERGK